MTTKTKINDHNLFREDFGDKNRTIRNGTIWTNNILFLSKISIRIFAQIFFTWNPNISNKKQIIKSIILSLEFFKCQNLNNIILFFISLLISNFHIKINVFGQSAYDTFSEYKKMSIEDSSFKIIHAIKYDTSYLKKAVNQIFSIWWYFLVKSNTSDFGWLLIC